MPFRQSEATVSLEATKTIELRCQREQFPHLEVKPPHYFGTGMIAIDPARDPFFYGRGGGGHKSPSYSFAAVQDFSA